MYGKYYKILGRVYRTNISNNWLQKSSIKLEGCSELTMKKYFSSLGRPQGGHVMPSPFFQPCYSTVLNEKSINLPPFFLRCAVFIHYSATTTKKMEFANFNFTALS